MIPGGNLLAAALKVISPQGFVLHRYQATVTNGIGFDVHTFSAPVTVSGSVQPASNKTYKELGLDWKKKHIQIWTTENIISLSRDRPNDQVEFNGSRYDIVERTPWEDIDGWSSYVAVEVPSA